MSVSAVALADVELKNDGFVDGQQAGFQTGFVAKEMAASRFNPPESGVALLKIQVVFGGGIAGTKKDVTLHIWDDAALTDEPGAELFKGNFTLTAANTALQEMDISAQSVVVTGPFRVGLEFTHDGLPSIARDDDGNIQPDRNFISAQAVGWKKAEDLGLTGDWILRAFVEGNGGSGGTGATGGGSTTSGMSGGTGGSGGGGGGQGGQGGNGGTNSGSSEGCSCNLPPSTSASPAGLLLALAAFTSLFRSRRRR
ncbi:MAG: hypothetical protein IPK82_41075 [Polyangiaceae bacterium]|nr:hypothetical protein [Polyangiaceae bacterium]